MIPGSLIFPLLVLGLITLLAVGLVMVHRRGRAGRRQLAIDLHDRHLLLDQRADRLEQHLESIRLGQRLAHLVSQAERSRRRELLSTDAADRLDALIEDWQAEFYASDRGA